MSHGAFTLADVDQSTPPPPQTAGKFTASDIDTAQPSAASRLGSNFLSGAGVVSQEQGKQFFVHPLDALKAMADQQGALGERAGKELANKDYVRGLTHGVEWLIPGLGPILAHAGDQGESGDIAGMTGTTLGAAANILAAHQMPGATAKLSTAIDAAKQAIPDAGAAVVRGTARGVNTALAKAPGTIGAAAGAGIGGAVGGHVGAEMGGIAGAVAGRELLPKLQIPGENFGLQKPVFPTEPLGPPTPAPELLQAQPLAQGGAAPPPEPSAGLATIPVRPLAELPVQAVHQAIGELGPKATIADLTERANKIAQLGELLNKGLGGKGLEPNVPLRQQGGVVTPKPVDGLPPNHIPVESSALKSYSYDPTKQEFESMTHTGAHYIHGDVSPEQAATFEAADSKGKAWNELRKNSTLVAKVVNGKRISVKPVISEDDAIDPAEWAAGHELETEVEGSKR